MPQWDLRHIAKQVAKRLKKINPLALPTHTLALNEMFDLFREHWWNPGFVCMVGNGLWQMPLPLGWRLLGEGSEANTVIEPSQASAAEWVDNPLLPEVYRGYWREKSAREREQSPNKDKR